MCSLFAVKFWCISTFALTITCIARENRNWLNFVCPLFRLCKPYGWLFRFVSSSFTLKWVPWDIRAVTTDADQSIAGVYDVARSLNNNFSVVCACAGQFDIIGKLIGSSSSLGGKKGEVFEDESWQMTVAYKKIMRCGVVQCSTSSVMAESVKE